MSEKPIIKKTRHFLSDLLIVLNIITVFFFCIIIFWSVYPYKVLEFKDNKFPVIIKTVEQGRDLQYISRYCKYMDLPATVTGTYANGIIYTVPTVNTNREAGCHSIIVQITIPLELPVGKIHFERVYQFRVNPIRTISITHRTEDFTIIESTQSAQLRLKGY